MGLLYGCMGVCSLVHACKQEFGKLVTAINLHIKSAKADISEAKWVCCLPILGCCIYPVKVGGVKTRLGRNITKIIKKNNAAWKESGRGLELRCATYSNNAYLSVRFLRASRSHVATHHMSLCVWL